ncbi:SpoIIE family protein phosphatase [Streptomyces antimycoticus]
MTSALRRMYDRLGASTGTVYLVSAERRMLEAAMTVDSPLSFSITPAIDPENLAWPTSIAYRTGQVVVFDEREARRVARHSPAAVVSIAFPMTVVCAPLRTSRHRFGIIGLRCVPPRPIAEEEAAYVLSIADELAVELENLADQGLPIEGASVPLFISSRPGSSAREGEGRQHGRPEAAATPVTGSSYLYQLQRLSTELTAAARVRDILAIAYAHIVRPFGGQTMTLCLVEEERLHVLGAAGLSREEVHYVEGTSLGQHTPETDTINNVEVNIFTSIEEFRQKYPDLGIDPERCARAYLPLISSGRAVGCCSLEFDSPGAPLSAEQIALLIIMLEQVGHSLERARSYEIDHALKRILQRGLLPRSLPYLPEAVTTARYFPAGEQAEVGGDWYDVVTLPDGGLGLVIGDVQGHSMEAAALMGQLRSSVRAYTTEGHGPATVLERSNRLLTELDTDLYATCCCMWLDLATGTVTAATAGHPEPLITDAGGRPIRPCLTPGPPLGIDKRATYQQSEAQVPPGAVAALFTDGLLDSRRLGTDGAIQRLARLLAENYGEDLEALADRMISNHGGGQAHDDAALVLVRYEGGQSHKHSRIARASVQRHDLQGVSSVRDFLRDLLHQWNVLPLLDELALTVSEVVTNALIHAQSDVDLRLRAYPDRIRVEVRDSDPYPPVPTALLHDDARNQEAESGRGLLIVDALTQTWGSSPSGRGKTTWFEIGIPNK